MVRPFPRTGAPPPLPIDGVWPYLRPTTRLPGMATRGWGGSIALAISVAGGIAAAELGLAYGLGIITWPTGTDVAGERTWLASLAWTTWVAATATAVGAVVADRLSRTGDASGWRSTAPAGADRPDANRAGPAGQAGTGQDADPPDTARPAARRAGQALASTAWRLSIALAAAIGGLLTVPLVAVPARATHRPETYAPQIIAGGYAVVGVVIGLVIAIAAVHARAVAINVCATGAWLWALAVAAAGHDVGHGGDTAQLGVWRFGTGHFLRDTFSLPGATSMLGAAVVIGALACWPAARRADGRVGMAVSGAFGPLLVAAAYFVAAPTLAGASPNERLSAYLIAPYAVVAGLAGSVLVTAIAVHRRERGARTSSGRVDGPGQGADPSRRGEAAKVDGGGMRPADRVVAAGATSR